MTRMRRRWAARSNSCCCCSAGNSDTSALRAQAGLSQGQTVDTPTSCVSGHEWDGFMGGWMDGSVGQWMHECICVRVTGNA
jgi:hypothetical protein